jgi:hypothetical protein
MTGGGSAMIRRWRPPPDSSSGDEELPSSEAQMTVPEPSVDDLASVLALVIVSDLNAEQVRERTGMPANGAESALARLVDSEIIFDSGGAYFRASQVECAGSCSRQGHQLRGQEVVIDPNSFSWSCAVCWDEELERRRSLGPSGHGA